MGNILTSILFINFFNACFDEIRAAIWEKSPEIAQVALRAADLHLEARADIE